MLRDPAIHDDPPIVLMVFMDYRDSSAPAARYARRARRPGNDV